MREHFHVPDNYFLSHSVGCLPKQTTGQLEAEYLAPWRQLGGQAWPHWMDVLEQFRAQIGHVLGVKARNMCPQANVSSALTKVIYSLPDLGQRTTILCTPEDFPTTGFVFKQAERAGFSIRFVEGDVSDPNAWRTAWDETVGIVHITHAFSNTSELAPVAEICDMARASGAISIVDIAQATGAIPVDVQSWKPDFAIGTGVKFLCCGPGACFLYASDAMIDASAPVDVGWFSHEAPFEMDIHDFRYAGSAMKFFGGTPSPAPFVMANSALSLWADLGWAPAQQRVQNLLSQMIQVVPNEALVSPKTPEHRGATLVINPPDRDGLSAALQAAQIQFDERREGFRFSVHGYTSDAEVETLSAALADGLR